ncbi:MAG TPA: hypothetical protein VL334_09735, partial [Anaerolineae bacterium]|nr:hypothetical protein [Anaerolineae bacterium]
MLPCNGVIKRQKNPTLPGRIRGSQAVDHEDKMLRYRNYTGIVEYDPDGKIFTGEVIGVRD